MRQDTDIFEGQTQESRSTTLNQKESGSHLTFKGVHIWYTSQPGNAENWLRAEQTTPILQMFFCMRGARRQDHKKASSFHAHHESNCLFFIPANCSNLISEKIDNECEVMVIHVDAPLFLDLLPKENTVLNSLRVKIDTQETIMLTSGYNTLTIGMKEIIHQILFCLRKDDCRCLFFHAKVLELLSLQLEQCENLGREGSADDALKNDELKRVYQVKEILERNSHKKFSLLGLAHTVGTNDATLKRHFKIVFGMTVFGYLNAYRMEQAKKILMQGDQKISAIAQQFGYKYSTHFSAAFKKYFGYPPTKVK